LSANVNPFGLLLTALVLLLVALVAAGRRRWRTATEGLVARLLERTSPAGARVVRFEALAGLPAPVQRYLRRVLTDGQPVIRSARLRQTGRFSLRPGEADGRPFEAVQTVTAHPPGFVWDARIELAPGLDVRVRDAYLGGAGSIHAAVATLVPLVDQRDRPELNAGALQRYLAEAAWYPTALLPGHGVTWTSIDEHAARATLADGPLAVDLDFRFDADGDLREVFTPARYREVGGRYVPLPWSGRYARYEAHHGLRLPTQAEVTWHLPEGDFTFFRGRVIGVEYEC